MKYYKIIETDHSDCENNAPLVIRPLKHSDTVSTDSSHKNGEAKSARQKVTLSEEKPETCPPLAWVQYLSPSKQSGESIDIVYKDQGPKAEPSARHPGPLLSLSLSAPEH